MRSPSIYSSGVMDQRAQRGALLREATPNRTANGG
jgi:hypothetical protein